MGSLEHKITPTKEAVERLTKILEEHDGKGTLDIIWGPDLDCIVVPDLDSVDEDITDVIVITKPKD